eukprot:COSAG02_NODE_45927_length_353_cov_0.594488_1_plen_64_part_10
MEITSSSPPEGLMWRWVGKVPSKTKARSCASSEGACQAKVIRDECFQRMSVLYQLPSGDRRRIE